MQRRHALRDIIALLVSWHMMLSQYCHNGNMALCKQNLEFWAHRHTHTDIKVIHEGNIIVFVILKGSRVRGQLTVASH